MRFARVDTIYLPDGWKLEIEEAPYSLAEAIVNVLTSCTLVVARPPALLLDAFAARRSVSVAALHEDRFVTFTGVVVSVHRRPAVGTVVEIRNLGECSILALPFGS